MEDELNKLAVVQAAKYHIATAAPHIKGRASITLIADLIQLIENTDDKLVELKKTLDDSWLANDMSYDTQGVNWLHNQLAILVDPEPPKDSDNG